MQLFIIKKKYFDPDLKKDSLFTKTNPINIFQDKVGVYSIGKLILKKRLLKRTALRNFQYTVCD